MCPKCGAEYVPPKTRNRKLAVKVDQPTQAAPPDNLDASNEASDNNIKDIEVEVDDVETADDEGTTLMEDASDMGDDQSDIAGMIVSKDDSSENL